MSGSKSKTKLQPKEGSSVGSITSTGSTTSLSVQTILAETKDPLDFVRKRGYEVSDMLGEGAFAKVYRAKMGPSQVNVAIKVFDLSVADRLWVEKGLKTEMFISRYVKHPNVMLSCEVFKTTNHGYIIMRLADKGSIKADLLRLKQPYSDETAKMHFKGLATGLHYLHQQNIVHRDLKLENFLISAKNVPMIADFGFAARAKVPNNVILNQMLRKTICGTAGYMAAELFPKTVASALGGNSQLPKDWSYEAKSVDIFAFGICLFEMLNLCKPFPDEMSIATVKKIAASDIVYQNAKVEKACKELISAMLRLEPSERPKAEEVLHHRWISHGSVFNTIIDKLT